MIFFSFFLFFFFSDDGFRFDKFGWFDDKFVGFGKEGRGKENERFF